MTTAQTLKGKFVRRAPDGSVIMGTKNRPEWSPLVPTCDTTQMVVGKYYEIDISGSSLTAVRPLSDSMPSSYSGSGSRPAQAQQGMAMRDVMIAATGIAKSAIEAGKSEEEAFAMAMRWSKLWMPPKRQEPAPKPPRPPVDDSVPVWDDEPY